jgi:prepilin-type N-terminal cleavage/methylation domain-containing protein
MKNNNKGFTLIELLAVIVELAIIMVIATQQINKQYQEQEQTQ